MQGRKAPDTVIQLQTTKHAASQTVCVQGKVFGVPGVAQHLPEPRDPGHGAALALGASTG